MQQSVTKVPFTKPGVEGLVRRAKSHAIKSWKHRHKRNGNKLRKPNQYNLVWFEVA